MSAAEEQPTAMAAVPPPIPGVPVDPPPKQVAETLAKVDDRGAAVGSGYRAFLRFSHANASLLAAGTTYFVFLAVLALMAFTFGVAALIGGERLADVLTRSASEAFPGLVGEGGLSPQTLMDVGRTTSVLGLLVLLYSGIGAMGAMSNSVHLIYGAAKDARNVVLAKARLLAWLLLLAPLMALSFIPGVVVGFFAEPALDVLGLQGTLGNITLRVLTSLVSIALNAVVLWLILGHMGGIRPGRGPRLAGTVVGAIGIEVLKYLLTVIVAWSVGKPQYGAFAAPIAMMFVLYLETIVLYAAAAITAGMAVATSDRDAVPAVVETIPT